MALDDELIDRNPVHIRGASNVKRTGTTQPASLDELEALAEATPERYRLMVLLAAWCALRKGELSELRRSDVDTTQWVLRVRRGVGFVPGRTVVKDPKTQAGKRDVAIPEHLVPMVREHLLRHAQQGGQGLMFPSARGEHLRTSAIGRWYYPAREAAGRPDLRFHDLRHTGAVLAAQSGATLAELMHRLGHTTPAAAMRYQHAAAERDREIAQRMSQRYREHVQARPSDCT
jgi:integrase